MPVGTTTIMIAVMEGDMKNIDTEQPIIWVKFFRPCDITILNELLKS